MRLRYSRDRVLRMVKRIVSIVVAILIPLSAKMPIEAEETTDEQYTDVVVVLDCSKSMEDIDSEYYAFDFIKGLSAIVPRHYRIGMIAYNNEVCVRLPLGSSYGMIENALDDLEYMRYGNAGVALSEALELFGDGQSEKRILLISDGEIMMDSKDKTEESAASFVFAEERAKNQGIVIDVVALGPQIEEGYTVYPAAETTGGQLYSLPDEDTLKNFTEAYLFDENRLGTRHVGRSGGNGGVLSVKLPDCLMNKAKIILLGIQQNENLTIICEADKINVLKGRLYTVIELLEPHSEEVQIQMPSDAATDISAYLTAEYDFNIKSGYRYLQDSGSAEIWIEMLGQDGSNLLGGYLKDEKPTIYLDGVQTESQIADGKLYIEKEYDQDATAELRISFDGLFGNYYGFTTTEERITVPVVEEPEEEPPEPDWLFWGIILFFLVALVFILCLSRRLNRKTHRKKMIEESGMLPKANPVHKNDFFGKVQVYVIRNRNDIDYPPGTINLFARCNREMITLEWILDACNLPLEAQGADKVIIKPGNDKSLVIKNNGKATALMGRELLEKNVSCRMYYNQKVTFIFDQEDTEIEVHYKDLKPNER